VTRRQRYIDGVVSLEFDQARCTGCGLCVEVCPRGVFAMANGVAQLVDRDACLECGACALNCLPEAITVNPGVGCAQAIIHGWLTGGEASCDC
jgi:NAD-dependent dihydropyrimidine dehydrogenase PreA subunit